MRLSVMASLKACAEKKDLYDGSRIHSDICNSGLLQKDAQLENSLATMYAKCGALVRAQQVIDELPVPWTALIAGYVHHGQAKEAITCFDRMQREGLFPNAITYSCMLKACGIVQDIDKGKRIHDEIIDFGLIAKNVVIGNALVDMYAKCGVFTKAHNVLDELPARNVVTWTALIAGYVQHGRAKEALGCFHQMQSEGLSPNAITYSCILKACGIMQNLDIGEQIHDEIIMQWLLAKSILLGNALVDMYVKCGVLMKAHKVLDELPLRNVISWNTLIAGYFRQEQGQEVLDCFQRLCSEGLFPSAITYAYVLKACAILQDVDMGKQIHDEIVSKGLLKKDIVLCRILVDMYAKCGVLLKAQKVFDELPFQDAVSWNALIGGYVQEGKGEEALDCFHRMQSEGFFPDAITFAYILKVCGSMQDVDMGKQIHDRIVSQGLLRKDIVLWRALVMYAKCGILLQAQKLFDELPVRDVVSWNALIAGYIQHGKAKKALGSFRRMRSEGFFPDIITYGCILKACGILQDVDMGKQMHDEIVSQGLVKKVVLCRALVDMYAKCGLLLKAQEVFDELPIRDAVSWNALIAGYVQQGKGEEAMGCFHRMRSEGFSPNAITYACMLKACGIMQEVNMGKQIHDEIATKELLKNDDVLCSALVDMYAKCGVLLKAQKVFDELLVRDAFSWNALIAGYAQQGQGQKALSCFQQMRSEGLSPDVVSWTALIGGYAQQGLAKEALDCFQWMQQEGISPDAITFGNVLNACSLSDLVDEGQMYFDNMRENFGIVPNQEHYACMVDLFGRARLFDEAMRVIMMVPLFNRPSVWSTLLGACQKWGNVKLGRPAFERSVQVNGCNAGAYIVMNNIYVAAGMQEEAQNIDRMRMKNAS